MISKAGFGQFSLALAMVGSMIVAVEARGDEDAVLIYSDQSPGAVAYAELSKLGAESGGKTVTTVTDPAEFVTQLATGDWSGVHLQARFVPDEPSYADALRAFATAHPGNPVQMYLWHDNGTEPTAETAVAASMAIVLWDGNTTTIAYSGIQDPKAGMAKTVAGYQFPDFAGIELLDPRIVARVPPEQASAPTHVLIEIIVVIITQLDCYLACATTYITDVTDCNNTRAAQVAQCESLYGPSDGDPGDPAQYLNCISQANQNHTNCLASAVFSYTNCVAMCDRETQAEPQGQ